MGPRWTSWASSYIHQLLVTWGRGVDFEYFIVKCIVVFTFINIYNTMTIRWMMQYGINEKTTFVQVMAWCHQATGHYLSQHWSIAMSLYDATNPQWANLEFSRPNYNVKHFYHVLGNHYMCQKYQQPNWNWFMMGLLAKMHWINWLWCCIITISEGI